MNYKIQWGDTLSALSRKFGTTVQQLAQANNIRNPDLIYAGANLKVPGKGHSDRASYQPAADTRASPTWTASRGPVDAGQGEAPPRAPPAARTT